MHRWWASACRWTKTFQTIFPRSKVIKVLVDLHGRPLPGHLDVKRHLTTSASVIIGNTGKRRWELVGEVWHLRNKPGPDALVRGSGAVRTCYCQHRRTLPECGRVNRYLLNPMDSFAERPHVYAMSNQETSTGAAVVVSSFCLFGVPGDLHSDQRRKLYLDSCEGVRHLDMRKIPPLLTCSWGPADGLFDAPNKLAREATHLPGPRSFNLWDHRHDDNRHNARERNKPVLWPCRGFPDVDQSASDFVVDIFARLHVIHHYVP